MVCLDELPKLRRHKGKKGGRIPNHKLLRNWGFGLLDCEAAVAIQGNRPDTDVGASEVDREVDALALGISD